MLRRIVINAVTMGRVGLNNTLAVGIRKRHENGHWLELVLAYSEGGEYRWVEAHDLFNRRGRVVSQVKKNSVTEEDRHAIVHLLKGYRFL